MKQMEITTLLLGVKSSNIWKYDGTIKWAWNWENILRSDSKCYDKVGIMKTCPDISKKPLPAIPPSYFYKPLSN